MPDGRRLSRRAHFRSRSTRPQSRARPRRAVGSAATQRLVRSLEQRALAIGVDRLDYSKGLPQRFEAFAHFLSQHPEWRSRISFLQIAPPSREEVPEYRELRSRLERLAGATNGRHAEPDWMPIRYVNRSFNQSTLAGFYRVADIAVVTPLRDGMNLVAKEFVAAQDRRESRRADPVELRGRGRRAARRRSSSIRSTPTTSRRVSRPRSTMPLAERRERWQAMFDSSAAATTSSPGGRAFLDALHGRALRAQPLKETRARDQPAVIAGDREPRRARRLLLRLRT